MKDMMKQCAQKCRWCPLIPIIIGIIALVLGIYLDPETLSVVWLVLSSLMILMGIVCLIMINVMAKSMK